MLNARTSAAGMEVHGQCASGPGNSRLQVRLAMASASERAIGALTSAGYYQYNAMIIPSRHVIDNL